LDIGTRQHPDESKTDTGLQVQARALGDPTRHAIFQHIVQAGRPLGIAELNAHLPFNHNAIRQHLAKLVSAGLVVEATAPAAGRGRPRLVYEANAATEQTWGGSGPYERLSRLLAEIIQSGATPEAVGRGAAPELRVASPSGDVVADVAAAMARQGFDPEVRPRRDGAEIVLQHCPFASAALVDRHTVCALHLGIAEGLADGAMTVDELVAYDPRKAGCRLRLRVTDDPASGSTTLTLRGAPKQAARST
jgi:predicted ArsR family transcriptional regulator